jgi:ABC-2 type transport system permease protein
MIARPQMPDWMQTAAKFNPVDWGVKAAREVVLPGTSWGSVGMYLMLLLALTAVTSACATWTFRVYQRSL